MSATAVMILAYLGIGAGFALGLAISWRAWVVFVLLWPIFAVLMVLSPAINWWVNREFRRRHG